MEEKQNPADVCLVMPPMVFDGMPSLALGILKACLTRENISCTVDYANMYFSYALGRECAAQLYHGDMTDFMGEYIFNEPAGITPGLSENEYIRIYLGDRYTPEAHFYIKDLLRFSKRIAAQETMRTVDRILARNPRVIGCTAVFQQRNASLAILREVKRRRPDIVTFMGGFSCFGSAGIAMLREFPFLDYVFFGESDDIFADVIRMFMSGQDSPLPYGVVKNGGPYPAEPPHRIVMNLDTVPAPDYDDFFAMFTKPEGIYMLQTYNASMAVRLILESSRGCWWGAKHPCSFCGLNGMTKIHRRKKPEQFLREIQEISTRYHHRHFCIADNIMPNEWFREVLPELAKQDIQLVVTTEVKANLREDQVRLLSEGGYRILQPGMESLSDHVLHLLDKGVTGIQNIALLKYAWKYQMQVLWNILTGAPGETVDDYECQTEIIPLLHHLQPPKNYSDILFVKDSVYYSNQEAYGLSLRPSPVFSCISPDSADYIRDIAFQFENINEKKNPFLVLAKRKLVNTVKDWIRAQGAVGPKPRLDCYEEGEKLIITDTRAVSESRKVVLSGIEKLVYQCASQPIARKHILALPETPDEAEVDAALSQLCRRKLMISLSGKYLALAVEISREDAYAKDYLDFCAQISLLPGVEKALPLSDPSTDPHWAEDFVQSAREHQFFFDRNTILSTQRVNGRRDIDI